MTQLDFSGSLVRSTVVTTPADRAASDSFVLLPDCENTSGLTPGLYRFRHRTARPPIEFEGRVHRHRGELYVRAVLRPVDPFAPSLDESPGVPLERFVGSYDVEPMG